MFKAKLIENKQYYSARRQLLVIGLFGAIFIGLLSSFIDLSVSIIVSAVVLGIAVIIQQSRLQKKMGQLTSQRTIEVTEDTIRVKDRSGALEQEIKLSDVDQIKIKDHYQMPDEDLKDLSQQLTGKYVKNYFIIQQASEEQKFEFEIDSYYMLGQLNKLVTSWNEQGIPVNTLAAI